MSKAFYKERALGTIFPYRERMIKVVKRPHSFECSMCFFNNKKSPEFKRKCSGKMVCSYWLRKDNTPVYFKEVSKEK